jgi:hypothetical protein
MKVIIATENGKRYYVERYEDDQFGFVLKARDATLFSVREAGTELMRLCYEYPTQRHQFEIIEEPSHFRIVARA